MDACGHPAILAHCDHKGRAAVFAGLQGCKLGPSDVSVAFWSVTGIGQGCTFFNEKRQWLGEVNGDELMFWSPQQLEVMRVQQNAYHIAWESFAQDPGTSHDQTVATLVLDSDARSLLPHLLETENACISELVEFYAASASSRSDRCCYSILAESELSATLRVLQAAVHKGIETWIVCWTTQTFPTIIAGQFGMVKSAVTETSLVLRTACIADACVVGFVSEFLSSDKQDEICTVMQCAEQRQVARVRRALCTAANPAEMVLLHGRGALTTLHLQAQTTQHQATLQVKAVGLNFRDVLNVLGMYPGDPGPPGGDSAGVACVQDHPNVFGMAFGSLKTYTTTDHRLLSAMPKGWSYTHASAMPTVWVTVWTAFEQLNPVAPDSIVIVQASTGGVGLGATQYLQRHGIRIVGTAGQELKREYLRKLQGVHTISSTRDSAVFAREAQLLLGCRHAACVLNSLSHGDYIAEAAKLLAPEGNFVELGKRNIRARAQMDGMKYHLVAVDNCLTLDPTWLHHALRLLNPHDTVASLPVHSFHLQKSDGLDAFQLLKLSNQIGKVVLQVEWMMHPWNHILKSEPNAHLLLTGGTGGLGLLLTQWMISRGASHLQLLSRSGGIAFGSEAHWASLTSCAAGGSSVQVDLCDVGVVQQAWRTVEGCSESPFGIAHCAGSLADALLANQSIEGE